MEVIKIKKGMDIPIKGEAEKVLKNIPEPEYVAVQPTDFIGMRPKVMVKPGDKVQAGTPLLFDKLNERIKITAPRSGEVVDIVRGEKRVLEKIVIKADAQCDYKRFTVTPSDIKDRARIVDILLESGAWAFLRQRPYDLIAQPEDLPKAIFISSFDSAPLAPDYDFIMHGKGECFQKGLDILHMLAPGNVHLGISARQTATRVFLKSQKVKMHAFEGPHPAGNVGIQIHHVAPIDKGEVVWYINPQDVLIIGKLFEDGIYDASRIVALTGSEVSSPRYYKTVLGAQITPLIEDNLKEGNHRFVSGNVLTGHKIEKKGFVGYYHHQLTVIPEGDHYAFMGWAAPGVTKHSMSHSFLSVLFPWKKYRMHTNLNGGPRPFVVSGQYEKVLPMDIFPVQLLKSIMIKDIDMMEKLGIYECSEEDFALCEYVCTSKTEVQALIREGLEYIREEMS